MRINEIFYSIQGEGAFTGTPAIFIRFAGCNLKCGFCDTKHESFIREMSIEEIVEEVRKYPSDHIVLTGGEPTLQVNDEFLAALKEYGFFIQIETNGTNYIESDDIDWVTCSPKHKEVVLDKVDELKVVYQGQSMERYDAMKAQMYYLQPCDVKDEEANKRNIQATIDYIKAHPKWRLSLQTQKILNIQ